MPANGQKPTEEAMFIKVWAESQTTIPMAASFPNLSVEFLAILIPCQKNSKNNIIMAAQPTNPNYSPIMEKPENAACGKVQFLPTKAHRPRSPGKIKPCAIAACRRQNKRPAAKE